MSVVFAIAILCASVITRVGGHLIDVQRAQHAADAVALAAIYDIQLAEVLASRNGAELVELNDQRHQDGTVSSLVWIDGLTRSAKALDTWNDSTPTLEP